MLSPIVSSINGVQPKFMVGPSTHGYLGHVNVIECPNKCEYSGELSFSIFVDCTRFSGSLYPSSLLCTVSTSTYALHLFLCFSERCQLFLGLYLISLCLGSVAPSRSSSRLSFLSWVFFFTVAFFFKSPSVALVASFFSLWHNVAIFLC